MPPRGMQDYAGNSRLTSNFTALQPRLLPSFLRVSRHWACFKGFLGGAVVARILNQHQEGLQPDIAARFLVYKWQGLRGSWVGRHRKSTQTSHRLLWTSLPSWVRPPEDDGNGE